MNSASVKWDGLQELRDALRKLPAELTADASGIVNSAGTGAKDEIVAAYAEGRKGNLKRGVTTEEQHTKFGVSVVVRSRAKHAWLYEYGSAPRETRKGKDRGSMPAKPTFVPIVVRRRRTMYERLKALLVSKGLLVSGHAGG